MKISLFNNFGAKNSVPIFQAIAQGLVSQGHTVVYHDLTADVAVIWSMLWAGRMRSNQEVYHTFRRQGKPVIVSINISNPMIFSEFENKVDAIVGEFGVQVDAMMDIVSGKVEPSGLLPMQMPKDMSTVEKQFEDTPHDMVPFKDSMGNTYDFGFGLNWKGIIKDARTIKYAVKK